MDQEKNLEQQEKKIGGTKRGWRNSKERNGFFSKLMQ